MFAVEDSPGKNDLGQRILCQKNLIIFKVVKIIISNISP